MALTLNANWLAAVTKQNAEIRYYVKVDVDGAAVYEFLSGPCAQVSLPESVSSVTPIQRSIDVMTREVKTGAASVTLLSDPYVIGMLSDNYIKHKELTIEIGEASLAIGDFEPFFLGVIHDYGISPGKVTLRGKSNLSHLVDNEVMGSFYRAHPLEMADEVMQAASVPTAKINSTDLDPTAYADIGHYCVTYGQKNLWGNQAKRIPINAKELLNQVAMMLNGAFIEDESGVVRYRHFDGSAASAADLTDDDIEDLKIVSMSNNMANRIEVSCEPQTDESRVGTFTYTGEDTASQTNYADPDGTAYIATKKFHVSFLGGLGFIEEVIEAATATVRIVSFGNLTGLRWTGTFPAGSQPANSAPTAARKMWVYVVKRALDGTLGEWIGLSGAAVTATADHGIYGTRVDPTDGSVDQFDVPRDADYTIHSRDDFGSAKINHAVGDVVLDMTIPVNMVTDRLTRFANGAPEIEVTTSLARYALQIGDVVTVASTAYPFAWKGHTALTSAIKWEVASKVVTISGGEVGCKLGLTYAYQTAPPAATDGYQLREPPSGGQLSKWVAETSGDVGAVHIVSGFVTSDGGGLTADVTGGVASTTYRRGLLYENRSVTLVASKDNWLAFNVEESTLSVRSTGLGGAEPDKTASEVWVAMVPTDGAAVDPPIVDKRVMTAISGSKLDAATVDTTQLAPLAVTEAKLGAAAVTEAKLGAAAVTSTKVGEDEIGPIHQNREQTFGAALNLNSTFSVRTKG